MGLFKGVRLCREEAIHRHDRSLAGKQEAKLGLGYVAYKNLKTRFVLRPLPRYGISSKT